MVAAGPPGAVEYDDDAIEFFFDFHYNIQHKSSLEQVSHDKLNNVESESNIFCGDTELRKRI